MKFDSPSRKPDDMVDSLRELDRRLRALEGANRLTSASIGSGGLKVFDGGDIILETRPGQFRQIQANRPERVSTSDNGFIVDTSWRSLSLVVNVPDWAHNAFMFYGGSVSGNNGSASADALWMRADWSASGGSSGGIGTLQSSTPSGHWRALTILDVIGEDVTNDTSITLQVKWRSASGSWGSHGSNHVNLRGLVIWNGFGESA